MKVYTKAGKEYKGSHHKMPNGQIHTGKKHTKNLCLVIQIWQ